MIGKLTGTLGDKNPPQVLVDCNGVGYEVDVPMSTFYNLPGVGEKVSLLTHFVVREDAQILYGFGSASERAACTSRRDSPPACAGACATSTTRTATIQRRNTPIP